MTIDAEIFRALAVTIADLVEDEIGKRHSLLPKDEYLTRQEAAEYLGVSVPTFTSWVKRGDVHEIQIDGTYRYSRSRLDADMQKIIRYSGRTVEADCIAFDMVNTPVKSKAG